MITNDNYLLAPGKTIDRFGPPGGKFLGEDGSPFANCALPPDSAGAGYCRYEVTDKPLPAGWRIEESVIAPGFGQPGGAKQYRILDSNGDSKTVTDLLDPSVGVLRDVS